MHKKTNAASTKPLNYQPLYNDYETIIIKNQLRQFLNQFYEHELQLLWLPTPMVQQMSQLVYVDVLNKINFSNPKTNDIYQFITNFHPHLTQFLHQHPNIHNSGVFANTQCLNKSFSDHNNIVDELDFLVKKIRLNEKNYQYIIDFVNQFWWLLRKFFHQNINRKNEYYQFIFNIEHLLTNLDRYLNQNTPSWKSSLLQKEKSLLYTNKLVLLNTKSCYNDLLNAHHMFAQTNDDVWYLVYVDSSNQTQVLLSVQFDQQHQNDVTNSAALLVCVNFSVVLTLMTQKRSIKELEFLYVAKT